MTFTTSVSAYANTALKWLNSQIATGTQTQAPTYVQAPISAPTANVTGNNTVNYKSTGLLSGLLGVEAQIPGGVVTDIGKGFAQAAVIAAIGYFVIKKI
jgi:hypothetical protein